MFAAFYPSDDLLPSEDVYEDLKIAKTGPTSEHYKALLSCACCHFDGLGCTPLHWAATEGNEEMVIDLLDGGANPDAQDTNGMTPLMLSVEYGGDKGAFGQLIDAGADIFLKNEFGLKAMDYAEKHAEEQPEMKEILNEMMTAKDFPRIWVLVKYDQTGRGVVVGQSVEHAPPGQ